MPKLSGLYETRGHGQECPCHISAESSGESSRGGDGGLSSAGITKGRSQEWLRYMAT
jgi:hypothetical protein